MPVYTVRIGKNLYKVDIRKDRFLVNGEPVGVQIRKLNDHGLFTLQRGEKKIEVVMSPRENNQISLVANRRHMTVQVNCGNARRVNGHTSVGTLEAPMPGTVVEVKVNEGQNVEKGQIVAVLESMKMQLEIRSPIKGIITKLMTVSGGKVEKGKALALVAPTAA